MGASSTAAGMKKYKPRRTPGSLDEVIYPETRAKMQEAKAEAADAKASAEAGAEYDKATTVGKKMGGMAKMASGGSASSRADGIASRGKTNCKMY
jgi:hypothetical protein